MVSYSFTIGSGSTKKKKRKTAIKKTIEEMQLAELKRKHNADIKRAGLKREIRKYQKMERIKAFDKKHPVFASIGRLGSGAGQALGKVGKRIGTPLTPNQQKRVDENRKRLKKLLEIG